MFRLKTRGVLRLLFIAIGAVTALISFALGQSVNFGVFSRAANALLHAGSLYPGVEPYFKYGPPFALAFIPFALVPAWLGAAAWGALNFGVAFEGLAQALDDDARLVPAAGLALVGVLLTTDGDQSNLLVTGLVLLAVAGYRRGTAFVGPGMLLAFAVYVKIFPILFAVFALHAKRPRRAVLAFAGALVLIGVAPVVALGPIELVAAFRGWVGMTRGDYGAVATGAVVPWSVGSMLRFGCALPLSSQNLELAGAVIAFSPLALSALPGSRARLHGSFGRMLVGSLLTYVVLFNHRSEYCSFVIGAIGVALWATAARHDLDANFVALFALAFIALGPFPTSAPVAPFSLELFVVPRAFHPLRMLGLFVLWILMQRDLWRAVFSREPHARLSQP